MFRVTIVPANSPTGDSDSNSSSASLALVPAEAARPAGVAGQVEDRGDGSYAASYLLALAGRHQLHILTPEGAPVAESPYPLLVGPAGLRLAYAVHACAWLCMPVHVCHTLCMSVHVWHMLRMSVMVRCVLVPAAGEGCPLLVATAVRPYCNRGYKYYNMLTGKRIHRATTHA